MKSFSDCQVVRALGIVNLGVPGSKPLGGSMVDSTFDPSEVDQMISESSWKRSGWK